MMSSRNFEDRSNIITQCNRLGLRVKAIVFNHFQQYSNYIVAVSFIGGGNRSTRRKAPTCRKSMTNFIT